MLSNEFQAVLKVQGLSTDCYIGVYDCDQVVGTLQGLAGDAMVIELADTAEAVRGARSPGHFVLIVGTQSASQVLAAIAADTSSLIAVIAVGEVSEDGPSAASLRSSGVMDVIVSPDEAILRSALKRGLEFRALRALELAHRCESARLLRRELDLLGHPPEYMTDDLSTFQPPPLPVGPTAVYDLDQASELFEKAYIDRVQHLCASAREAALHLDVSAATLARRLRKESSENGA